MKYLWILVVVSASAFGQNAYGPDFLNLHCTSPDPLAQTLFNIPPRPGLVPDRSANGNAVVYCDSLGGGLKLSFSGGAYVSLGGAASLPTAASGSVFASQGVGIPSALQVKPVFDMRDFGAKVNGSHDDTPAMQLFLTTVGSTQSTLQVPGISKLGSVIIPPNVTVDFANNGGFSPISTTTAPGGATFVQGAGSTNSATATTSCSVSLTGVTAGNTLVFMENHFFTSGAVLPGSVTDTVGDSFVNVTQQGFNFTSINTGWVASNVAGGSITITVQLPTNNGAVPNSCIAWEIGGMGPIVGLDAGIPDIETSSWTNAFMQSPGVQVPGPLTVTTGAIVIGFGGQTWQGVTCTAGTGYTQPAGSAGQVQGGAQPSTGFQTSFCAEYLLSSPGGSTTVKQNISSAINSPCPCPPGLNRYWAYTAMSLIPASATINIQGPVLTGTRQIFYNSLPTQGTIDFSGNNFIDKVYPEWWGALPSATAAVNTPAIQASINGAFGTNRFNGSQLNQYNRELHFGGLYNINGTLNINHMNGFRWTCSNRFMCGFNQQAANTSIIHSTTGGTYGMFEDMGFSTSASQNLSSPLVNLDYTGSPSSDLKTQFIDCIRCLLNGNGLASIGFQIAASGGAAQGSNITFYNDLAESFTEAAYMIGAGSGGVSTTIATNAITINWINGDCQRNPAYCIEAFGLQAGKVDTMSFEDCFSIKVSSCNQTGYDIWATQGVAGGVFEIDNVRSESAFLAGGQTSFVVRNSYNLDQASVVQSGQSYFLGDIIQGTGPGGHGVYYKVTTAGTPTLLGAVSVPLTASSGTATTIVDSVGGFTVNAWVGYQVSILAGTAKNQYCIVTSNTATTFTCTGGWLTDFNTVTIANPDNTSQYMVEPQWGTQFSSGTLVWAAITKTLFGGALDVDWAFLPGVQLSSAGTLNHLQVTRGDWLNSTAIDNVNISSGINAVLAGVPSGGAGTGDGTLGAGSLIRSWKLPRNSLTEIPQTIQSLLGTTILHWASGQLGGGLSVSDIYAGNTGTTTGQGQFYINNHSSGSSKIWNFNFDGSSSFPGAITAAGGTPTVSGTGACATTSTQVGGKWAGLVTCTGATGASTLVITPGITAPNGFRCPADDETTNANKLTQSTQSTTTCTISGTVNANDVIAFGPIVAF